jgi:hypothetical protein
MYENIHGLLKNAVIIGQLKLLIKSYKLQDLVVSMVIFTLQCILLDKTYIPPLEAKKATHTNYYVTCAACLTSHGQKLTSMVNACYITILTQG